MMNSLFTTEPRRIQNTSCISDLSSHTHKDPLISHYAFCVRVFGTSLYSIRTQDG
eukprot:m.15462 g.15462  ORF g.15462 m.15462 type:complete len:55 (+) comp10749_c0_seq1:4174-4338(+)